MQATYLKIMDVIIGLGLTNFLSRIAAAVLILAAGWIAIRILAKALRRITLNVDEGRRMGIGFLSSVVIKVCWAILAVVVLGKLGVNVGPIVAGLGVTGFILGFAFQESLGSLASGLMIALNNPFKVGDRVTIAGFEGKVQRLDMMAVTILTDDGRRVTIPNKSVWGGAIVNFTAGKAA